MYLSNVVIKKFRNFSDLTVTLSKGLNVLVGENNIGKTNLLDAIRIALGSSAATGEIVRVGKEDRHRNADGTYCTEPIRISLIFSALSEDEQGQFIDILNYDPEYPSKSTAQINYEWNWNEKISRWNSRRWGGAADDSDSSVPEDLLQSIPITLLGALRDALSGLMPGRQSRLGHLLQARATDDQKNGLQEILLTANNALEKEKLISTSQDLIGKSLEGASGKLLSQKAVIRASEPDFERIVQNLRLVLKIGNSDVVEELRSNGLGYNNLLFIGTVTTELEVSARAILPLLLVEEPEAHLHPQLQTLLANFLAKGGIAEPVQVQTIITTHSPSIAAHVSPSCLKILHRTPKKEHACVDIASCNLSPDESSALRRMLDVTRATMLFSRGVVLVEGITEALLIPVLDSVVTRGSPRERGNVSAR